MDATVKAYLQSVFNIAKTVVGKFSGTTIDSLANAPQFTENYKYVSSVQGLLKGFWSGADLSATVDADISYIEKDYNTSAPKDNLDNNTGGEKDFVLGYKDPSELLKMLEDALVITIKTPDKTSFVLPSTTMFTDLTPPTLDSPIEFTTELKKINVYDSDYLTNISSYVLTVLDGNMPFDIINKEKELLDYNLDVVVRRAFAQSSGNGFRLPNSNTLLVVKQINDKFFERVQGLCKEFVNATSSFITKTTQLGISKERLESDFTNNINKVIMQTADFELARYKDKIEWQIQKFNTDIEKQNTKLLENKFSIQKSLFDVKATLLNLAVESSKNKISMDKAQNLMQFADIYNSANEQWLQERISDKSTEIFDMNSQVYKTLSDSSVAKEGLMAKIKLNEANKKVLTDKLNILQADLAAYNDMIGVIQSDVTVAKSVFEKSLLEFENKIDAFNKAPKILQGASAIAGAILDSDITISKQVGA